MSGQASARARTPRVVIASRLYAPEPAAAAQQLAALARALRAAGARVEVLTTRPPRAAAGHPRDGGTHDAQDGGVRVRRWPVLRDRSGRVRGYLQYASYDVPLALRLLLARRPDVVVVQPPPTTGAVVRVVAALRRVPYVYYADDVLSAAAEGAGVPAPLLAVLRRLESFALGGARRVLTVSDQVGQVLVGLGVRPERVDVVGTGVDTTALTPSVDTRRTDWVDDGPLLVYAGTMSEVHGAGVFVDAFALAAAQVPGARLVMLGDGTERAALERRAARLAPGAVKFRGQVPVAEVARWMSRARAGLASVRPGSGYEFAFATKMFAATACGAPVVFAGAGPCAALVADHHLGWATAWDVGDVAAAMVAALREPPSAARREALAAWTREGFSVDAVAGRAAAAVLRG